MELPAHGRPLAGVVLVGQQLYQGFQILRCNPLRRPAQPVEAIDGQMFRWNAADDLAGQGAVHYPGVCLGAVPYTGAAQEPFQPGWAVRQNQQGALPFAGGRLQEYDELPVKIVREGAALLVELFQLHTVVIDHPIGGYGTVLV